jgi:hypothetical protein
MRRHSVLSIVVVALGLAPLSAARADLGETARPAARAVHDIWATVQQLAGVDSATQHPARPAPQAIPAGGPAVNLSDVSHPSDVEAKLRGVARLPAARVQVTVPGGQARLGDFSVGSDQTLSGNLLVLHGNADVYGKLEGNLVAYDGDVTVHAGGAVTGDVLAIDGTVHDQGEVGGEVRTYQATVAARAPAPPMSAGALVARNVAGLAGVVLTLVALGFGLVLFGRPNLEIVSDTVTHSFARSFVTGLIGQILLLPTFGMLVVGLILSVAGILLLPFAVAVYVLLVIVGIVGGALAVAHAMGETWTRRRLARGAMGSPNGYRYLMVGLAGPVAIWLAWALFGWVPVAGDLIRGAAILVTWLITTAGFGAALLSRAGARESFAGRIIPPEALTDEYLWATPQFGVPAVRRPGKR